MSIHINRRAVSDVIIEMDRQDDKWGADRDQKYLLWNAILLEEVGEVNNELLDIHFRDKNSEDLREELVQVAAVTMQWIENIDRSRS